jgi:tRNA-splicing ligase RtcB
LGSGNHYIEIQRIAQIYDDGTAGDHGLRENEVVVTIHCGSRGLGHQIGTDFLREMDAEATSFGLNFPIASWPRPRSIQRLAAGNLGAMRAGINCALANRQIIAHLAREVFSDFFPEATLKLLYDVSHNACKVEEHRIDNRPRSLYVHRKGATRAFGPGHPELPVEFRNVGQPVLIGGSMGTCSYILAGVEQKPEQAFSSAIHGAGRAMSRHQAARTWHGRRVVDELAKRGILIRCESMRSIAEEAPGAYKDVTAVVDAAGKQVWPGWWPASSPWCGLVRWPFPRVVWSQTQVRYLFQLIDFVAGGGHPFGHVLKSEPAARK